MSLFAEFYHQIALNRLAPWLESLPAHFASWEPGRDFWQQQKILAQLPQTQPAFVELEHSVTLGRAEDISGAEQERIRKLLLQLKPWRKGPFEIHGIQLDTEWRSDWKWQRLLPHISDLSGRYVLDVGCGSGYHLWRMKGAGAKCVVGVDPYPLFLSQFLAIRHFYPTHDIHFLPIGIDEVPPKALFDTVFAMGVLYHRRSPLDFLRQLRALLVKGGELVLETLVIEGDAQSVLTPVDRYARMRNVWMIPSTEALTIWLQRSGFDQIRLVDLNRTSTQEQRQTEWMDSESLQQCLDPADPLKTVEGYPAPLRAILIARAR